MKIKLRYNELMALKNLFEVAVCGDRPDGLFEKLIQTLMLDLYRRISAKSLFVKQSYQIELKEEIAIAFLLYWTEINLKHMPFEDNLVRRIIALIDKKIC